MLGFGGFLMLGWFFPNPAHNMEKVRIGLSVRNVVFLPFYYAKDKGIFQKYGLEVELIQRSSIIPC